MSSQLLHDRQHLPQVQKSDLDRSDIKIDDWAMHSLDASVMQDNFFSPILLLFYPISTRWSWMIPY